MADKLSTYKKKRDFSATSEPGAGAPPKADGARFVIQEHHATRLHWDLRLERDGVLVSWAIPNGIPHDPKQNRKAVHTEDHPLEYIDFHGEIPQGNYGAGTMTIWDSGTYECEKFRANEVIVTFHGERVQGRYALFQTGKGKDWMIHRMDPPADPDREPMPERLVPMLAKAGTLPVDDAKWAFEIKWDGIRALVYSEPGRLRIESRNLNDLTAQYPELAPLNRALSSHDAILDGEIVAFDGDGRPSFERLQQRMHQTSESVIRRRAKEVPVAYVIFDVLFLDGHSLMDLAYGDRRARLEDLGLDGPAWQTPAYRAGEGAAMLEATAAQRLEGVVAKRLDSIYEPGKRAGAWIKVKNQARQELVIGGWLPGAGRRKNRIGALLVGYYEGPDLRFAGKVGTGFKESDLVDLERRFEPLTREASPFEGKQPQRGSHFVEPELVAEFEFTEWTRERLLRHPSYKGLRGDKDARDVVLEAPPGGAPQPTAAPEPRFKPKSKSRTKAKAKPRPRAAKKAPADSAIEVLHTLSNGDLEVRIDDRELKLSNQAKVLYPQTGFTKGQVVDYYARIAPALLPHLHGRPLTLKRYPNGVEGKFFYEKQCPKHRPDWVQTAPVAAKGKTIDFCLAQDLPTLVWAANLADLELHTSLSMADPIERPTMLVFDLDPGAPADVLDCAEVGLWLRDMFSELGLKTWIKTSGSKGMQAYVPLNTPITYDQTKPFARAVAELLEKAHPDRIVSRQTKSLRPGKILVDWSQNDEHKTTVNVYSLRAKDRPTVSTPVTWEEVERAVSERDAALLCFEAEDVLDRVAADGDLFAPLLSLAQQLPAF